MKTTITRESTTITAATTAAHESKAHWRPLYTIGSMADTLPAINAAIEAATGDTDFCYDDEAALAADIREGWITFHTDGFIIWFDAMGGC